MLRILLILTAVLFLSSGPSKQRSLTPNENPLSELSSCEENWPPKLCPPYCDCS